MRTKLRSKFSLLFMTCALLIAIPAIALADIVANNLDTVVDNTAEIMPLQVGGANGTTKLYVLNTNASGSGFGPGFSDPNNPCNLAGASNLQLDVTSSNPSVATVSPASVTINDCEELNGVTLTVSPVAAGSTQITVARKAGTTSSAPGTFHFGPATFDVNVTPPPNTPPQVQVTGVTGGASYAKGSVPTATCQVTDAEDGPSSFSATLGPITGPNASDGIGSQEASCSYTDQGPGPGLTATASVFYNIVDPSGPVITKVVTPASPDGDNGWYTSDVTVDWTVSDPESPNSIVKTGCVDQNITSDQPATTYTCSATSAGGSAPEQSVTIKRDATAPDVTLGAVSGTEGSNGWYTSAVTQTFNASDALSGLAGPASIDVSSGANEEGSNVNILSGPVSDIAGNTASASAGPFKIDLSDPTITAVLNPPNPASSGWYNAATGAPTVSFQCSDEVSGLDANACPAAHTFGNGEDQSHSGTVTDRAGRSATAGVNDVDVDLDAPSAPTATTDPTDPVANSGGFFKDSVKVSYGGSTDVGPSGVKGYSADQTFDTTGTHNYSGTATDNAGNESAATTGQVKVDAGDPTVGISGCPTNPVVLNSSQSINVTASDDANGSGLVSDPSGSVSLDTSSVGSKSKTITVEDKVGHTKSATCSYSVVYNWNGFRQPVDNLPTLNTVKAGQSIPMKFSLSGNQGLNILQPSTTTAPNPKVTAITCPGGSTPMDAIEQTTTANNGLTYDATADQYNYVWKTQSTYAGKCYRFDMQLIDGTTHSALFKFSK